MARIVIFVLISLFFMSKTGNVYSKIHHSTTDVDFAPGRNVFKKASVTFPLQQNYSEKQIDSLINVGNAMVHTEPKKLIALSTQLYTASEKLGYEKGIMQSMLLKLRVYKALRDNKNIIEYAQQTEDYAKKINDDFSYVKILNIKAHQYKELKLYDKALKLIDQALQITESLPKEERVYRTKGNLYIEKSNVLHDIGKSEALTLRYRLLGMRQYEKAKHHPDAIDHTDAQYQGVGVSYLHLKKYDSAKYYFDKSLKASLFYKDSAAISGSYSNLAALYYVQKDFRKAIQYAEKGLEVDKKVRNYYLLSEKYNVITQSYKGLNDNDNFVKSNTLYLAYKDSMNMQDKETAAATINYVTDRLDKQKEKSRLNVYLLITIIALLIITFIYLLKFSHKKRQEEQRIKEAVIWEKEQKINKLTIQVNDAFEEVIQLAKQNDPAFLARFQEVYPEIYYKLIEANPKLVNTELILCAMIWLNFSSKDIAQYTFVQPKTVQVKKHRLRKKLDIPTEEDIYLFLKKL